MDLPWSMQILYIYANATVMKWSMLLFKNHIENCHFLQNLYSLNLSGAIKTGQKPQQLN